MSDWNGVPQQNTQFIPAPKPKKSKKWIHFITYPVLFFIALGIGASGNTSDTTTNVSAPQPTATVTESVPAPAKTVTAPPVTTTVTEKPAAPETTEPESTITEGTYEVGVDIQPGKYKTKGDELCYWARLKNLDGSLNSIITNHLGEGAQTVTIKKSDKGFETNGCGEWTKVG
jgi:hypothetical protein